MCIFSFCTFSVAFHRIEFVREHCDKFAQYDVLVHLANSFLFIPLKLETGKKSLYTEQTNELICIK